MLYCFAVCAERPRKDGVLGDEIFISPGATNASNQDEAYGKAMRIALKLLPPSKRWTRHTANVCLVEKCTIENPDTAIWTGGGPDEEKP